MTMSHDVMHVTYDFRVVALSIAIASVSAYAGLSMGERVSQNRGRARLFWLIGGAIALGAGVWSMHFTGMLAYHLPVPIAYDLPTVAISLVAAILALGVALAVVSRAAMTTKAWLAGGFWMGSGITIMHYSGMAAMRVSAAPRYDLGIVALSVGIAIVTSLVGLRLSYRFRAVTGRRFELRRIAAALVMGLAVAGMHYTGMAAASFAPAPAVPPAGLVVSASVLGGSAIAIVTFVVLIIALAISYVDRRFVAAQNSLAEAQSHFGAVVASAPVMIFAVDAGGDVTMAQGRDLERIHCDPKDAVGTPFTQVFADVPDWLEYVRRGLDGEESTTVSDVHGSVVEMRWMPTHGDDGTVISLTAVGTDITERRRAEEALHRQAFHDDLTGLPNRASLNKELALAIETASADGSNVVLAVLDLNRFKNVNDTLGHEFGDVLLRDVSRRLRDVLRPSDFVARLGGDEFAVIVPNASHKVGAGVAKRIVTALRHPFEARDHVFDISASVGVALYPQHALDATTLLRHADVAMYVAKRAGADSALYEPYHDAHSPERLLMENGLRRAIADDELVLHYQPTIELATNRVTGVEALVRWDHPTLGRLAPDRFIPMAEETGLILPVTEWVLETALKRLQAWQRDGLDLRVAVNISTRTLLDHDLPGLIDRRLRHHDIRPDRLVLEITETALMAQTDGTRHVLSELAALGVTLSIDDFGTGYSSLAYLAQLPVREIKIDKSFVIAMNSDGKDASIVRWISGLGHVLGLRVVAEGVETAQAFEAVKALECDVAQGYFLSRPMPADEVANWIGTRQTLADVATPSAGVD